MEVDIAVDGAQSSRVNIEIAYRILKILDISSKI